MLNKKLQFNAIIRFRPFKQEFNKINRNHWLPTKDRDNSSCSWNIFSFYLFSFFLKTGSRSLKKASLDLMFSCLSLHGVGLKVCVITSAGSSNYVSVDWVKGCHHWSLFSQIIPNCGLCMSAVPGLLRLTLSSLFCFPQQLVLLPGEGNFHQDLLGTHNHLFWRSILNTSELV